MVGSFNAARADPSVDGTRISRLTAAAVLSQTAPVKALASMTPLPPTQTPTDARSRRLRRRDSVRSFARQLE
jgi:hypothetical protein